MAMDETHHEGEAPVRCDRITMLWVAVAALLLAFAGSMTLAGLLRADPNAADMWAAVAVAGWCAMLLALLALAAAVLRFARACGCPPDDRTGEGGGRKEKGQ